MSTIENKRPFTTEDRYAIEKVIKSKDEVLLKLIEATYKNVDLSKDYAFFIEVHRAPCSKEFRRMIRRLFKSNKVVNAVMGTCSMNQCVYDKGVIIHLARAARDNGITIDFNNIINYWI